MKPFSESCEQNKNVILEIIKPILSSCKNVLEIVSGTGQHAVYFAQQMPHLQWYTSDRIEALNGIQMWLDEFQSEGNLKNVHPPVSLDVVQSQWPELSVDAIFTANTLHIMSRYEVQVFFERVPQVLNDGGLLIVYGPFNYQGQYTSDSNRQFDGWLKSRNPQSCIKDFSELNDWAEKSGFKILVDYEMPANNRILLWQKEAV
ncbi:MAG: DUF938 domain-containing protein [gamma proteobacterium symbiont of Bathyaustriella thionipta]|nr:DUF938 domain-containing protein [gamma proteobacterium symbiont of Bathyaustriella thionipta]MCU7949612.1 DUF938 domain-containing protein [gamma proteobacterium symbiont of Bathyaustriella thionipta]MCU7954760.1 DUF938 domain-containing protein [gamma proteobacterium symbiont of Bathyaustriella thionipta]MCU7956600.1 DUF938 domain-containing protein [gamma proteobacterium symbiont of Bathyaustriella thionipta]